ncbi:HIT family protein [Arcobacter porcinus]|uniref:Histidine triad nucleotide-binding protein n=1 Tax=Arcobacter porcinus TaxID=1935204 RepID=A0A5C2HDN0_9BACT|nr:HIT family protein [Arcobacter porcinus]OCL82474.1 hypothetical protein AAW29_01417 [Arcobacter porcinus]OCL82536.1 hypothetical protein AAW30_01360 [Arcobacter porcinus]OCL91400.1 hypothetical protein AAX27_01347 [Aliarcobacter thereius]QEP40284.1 histidine triad nucleotide-binding protein [Arcobacter porcinus]
MQIYKNNLINIQIEKSEIPWLKIFVNREVKEFSDCTFEEKLEVLKTLEIVEKSMIKYFKCDKVNIASFGNYVAQVHFHIMARFKEDSYFPESMWGTKQRESNLTLPSFEEFYELVKKSL